MSATFHLHTSDCDVLQDKIDMNVFELQLLGKKFDMTAYLQGQPVRVLARTLDPVGASNCYAWNFEVWHEKQTGEMCQSSDYAAVE